MVLIPDSDDADTAFFSEPAHWRIGKGRDHTVTVATLLGGRHTHICFCPDGLCSHAIQSSAGSVLGLMNNSRALDR